MNDNDHKLMSGDLLFFLFIQSKSWHQQQQIDKHHKLKNNVNVSSRAGI